MEFVSYSEAWAALRQQGLEEAERTETELHLGLADTEGVTVIDVAASDHRLASTLPASVRQVPRAAIPIIVESIVHKLGLDPVLLIPVGVWREVFNAVAFGMAECEPWKVVDSTASVELNTRDPLLLGPGDHVALREVVRVLLSEGTKDTQGLSIAATGSAILIEVLPSGQMILFLGNPPMASLVQEVIDHSVEAVSPVASKRAPQRPHS